MRGIDVRRTVRAGTAVLAALALLPHAYAQDAAPSEVPGDAAAPREAVTGRARLEWITAAGSVVPRDTLVNPGNAVLLLPQAAATSELRPELRVEYAGQLDAVIRPRLLLEIQKPRADDRWQPERFEARSEWIDLYASWRFDERLAAAYGLQNFQWGPAELASPSNRIFHETGFARDPLYLVRGKHLARVNLSFGKSWSAVILAEVRPNEQAPFIAGEPFDPKAQAKLEWSAPSGRGLAAVTAGTGRRTRGWFGEYGSLSLTDGLSIYADVVHQLGSRAWYPSETGAFAQTETRAGLRTLALGGVRYTFQGGADLRFEYLFDEAGWTHAQLALASRVAAQFRATLGSTQIVPAGSPQAVAVWLDPGFEILGRQHAYVSLTLPDLPPGKKTLLQLRYLAALEDGSGLAFATASFAVADSVVAFASAAGSHGDEHGALSRLIRASATVGTLVSW